MGLNRLTQAVIRICSPRFRAITDPIIASHKNKIEASSSDQTSGESKKYRPTTPENNIAIHAKTRRAATPSTILKMTDSEHLILRTNCLNKAHYSLKK